MIQFNHPKKQDPHHMSDILFSSFWMTFLIRHLKGLIFDCLSFTKGLITFLSTVDNGAPAPSSTSVTSLWPYLAASCRDVLP